MWKSILLGLFSLTAYASSSFIDTTPGVKYEASYSVDPKIEYSFNGDNYYPLGNAFHCATDVNLGLIALKFSNRGNKDVRLTFKGALKDQLATYGTKVSSTLKILSVSKSGREIRLGVNYANKNFRLASGETDFDVVVTAKVDTCDGKTIIAPYKRDADKIKDATAAGKVLTDADDVKPSLEKMIEGFQDNDLQKALYCDLSIKEIATSAIHKPFHKDDKLELKPQAVLRLDGNKQTVTLISSTPDRFGSRNKDIVSGPDETVVTYRLPDKKNSDADKIKDGMAAAKVLTDAIHDYGDLLIILADEDSVKQKAATDQFFSKEKVTAIVQNIRKLNEGIPHMNLNEVLSVHFSVNRAYEYVHYFEGKILKEYKLDYMLRSFKN